MKQIRSLIQILLGIVLSSISLMLCSCERNKTEFEYFENGKLKTKYILLNGKKQASIHYDSGSGSVYSERHYRNDTIVKYIDYFKNGKIQRQGGFLESGEFNVINYYENGNVNSIAKFDKDGSLLEEDNYYRNGIRDSIPYPYVFIKDTKAGIKTSLIARILNIAPGSAFSLEPGELILGYRVDTIKNSPVIRDTLAVILPTEPFTYRYQFLPNKTGKNTIYCQITLKVKRKKTSDILGFLFEESFVVHK